MNEKHKRFERYAWFVLVLNVAVILWGAVVRATGAGAGCGNHWPLCNGEVIPPAPALKTIIEFGHRVTSGMALLCVVGMVVWAFRAFPKGHVVRRAALFSLGFELAEGLIGAGLVLLGHVAGNTSAQRGYSLALHLSNTLLLLAALSLTAWFAQDRHHGTWTPPRNLRTLLAVAAVGIVLIGITGAIAALGDTLFASSSLAEGMREDFASGAHPFVRLRVLHPIVACALAAYILFLAVWALRFSGSDMVRKLGIGLVLVTVAQLCLGAVNLVLMAPVPVQLMHLFLADLLWITFILLSTELIAPV